MKRDVITDISAGKFTSSTVMIQLEILLLLMEITRIDKFLH